MSLSVLYLSPSGPGDRGPRSTSEAVTHREEEERGLSCRPDRHPHQPPPHPLPSGAVLGAHSGSPSGRDQKTQPETREIAIRQTQAVLVLQASPKTPIQSREGEEGEAGEVTSITGEDLAQEERVQE